MDLMLAWIKSESQVNQSSVMSSGSAWPSQQYHVSKEEEKTDNRTPVSDTIFYDRIMKGISSAVVVSA